MCEILKFGHDSTEIDQMRDWMDDFRAHAERHGNAQALRDISDALGEPSMEE